jgi:hypothetical protein
MNRDTALNQIRRDKAEILSLKKATIKNSDATILSSVVDSGEVSKMMPMDRLPMDTDEAVYRTLIANTYNYMDSHSDVHLNGLFSKSIQETKKIFLLHDHKFEVTAQIGNILKAREQDTRFIYLGYNSPLDTQALLLDVEIQKAKNEAVFTAYKDNEINQHSVGMYYVKVDLAMDAKEDPNAYALYQKYLPLIGNADEVMKQGYFFAVSEAKLKETSAVLMGSNPITGVFDNNKSAHNVDQVQKMFDYLAKNIDNKEIYYNICKQYCDTFAKNEPLKDTQKDIKPSIYQLIK